MKDHSPITIHYSRRTISALLVVMCLVISASAQRQVSFPPAESPPPPPVKEPPRTQTSGEETDILLDSGPTMRKTQDRTPPPPTTLTVMYKLKYGSILEYVHPDGRVQKFEQWKSYPNDASTLVSLTNYRLDDGNNYQYAEMALAHGPFDPLDIPILFMAGDYEFAFSDDEIENLRRYLLEGGTIVFNAARGRDEFSYSVVREMRRLLPDKTFMRLPPDHPIFNTRYRLKKVLTMINGVRSMSPPEIYAIDIGTRAAVILTPVGMGASWSDTEYHAAGKHLVGESARRLGVNLVAYALGVTQYGRFLAQEFPVFKGASAAGDVFRFALIQYSGSWDVNPAIQTSVQSALNDNTGIAVDYAPHVVRLDDPRLMNYPLSFMTGHYDFELTPEEKSNLSAYLRRGGVLVASAAGGLSPFDKAFRREIKDVIPDAGLIPLPPSHPLFLSGWNAIHKVRYTAPVLRDHPGLDTPELYALFIQSRPAVIYSPWDLLSGVNRESNVYAKGVADDDATRLLINALTYLLSH